MFLTDRILDHVIGRAVIHRLVNLAPEMRLRKRGAARHEYTPDCKSYFNCTFIRELQPSLRPINDVGSRTFVCPRELSRGGGRLLIVMATHQNNQLDRLIGRLFLHYVSAGAIARVSNDWGKKGLALYGVAGQRGFEQEL